MNNAKCLDCLLTEHLHIKDKITNGDVIKALFPKYYQNILSYLDNTSWWNAPYKAESEDKE